VILDESVSNENQQLQLRTDDDATLIVERHLHHFFEDDEFKRRVLKHWIPANAAPCEIEYYGTKNNLSQFYKIKEKVYCLY